MDQAIGWIIYNGNMKEEKFHDLAVWLDEVANKRGLSTQLIRNNDLIVTIENGNNTIKGKYEGQKPDFVIFVDKDIYLARQLESMGIRLYNSASSIEICDDKSLTYQALANKNIPIPKTIVAPKVFYKVFSFENYKFIADELGFPMVIKEAFGSFGQQVYLVENYGEMLDKIKELGNKPYLFQQFIKSSYGRDIRLHVVDGRVVTSMLRMSDVDFRANVSNGGKMHLYFPTDDEIELAIKAQKAVGVDFAGIDILFGEDERPIICEVNSNAHIKNIYNCTGVNVAEHIVDYIIDDLNSSKRG